MLTPRELEQLISQIKARLARTPADQSQWLRRELLRMEGELLLWG